jgi:hypothetical protein
MEGLRAASAAITVRRTTTPEVSKHPRIGRKPIPVLGLADFASSKRRGTPRGRYGSLRSGVRHFLQPSIL